MKNYELKRKAAVISLLVGVAMFVAKMGAYLITGSSAIFSDAAESVVHVLATTMALFSIVLSAKPADKSHLYGHGNIEYFSAAIEGLLIIIAAIFIIYTSVAAIITGTTLHRLDTGIVIVSTAGLINLILGFYLVRTGKKTNSLTLTADGKHVLTDSYTSLGVIAGIVLVIITGNNIFDPIFAIGIAINILFTGYFLIRESIAGLMIENKPAEMETIAAKLVGLRKDHWIDIHELRFWKSGDTMFIDFHLIYPSYFTIKQSHTEERIIRDSLKELYPEIQTKIHFDYCKPDLCKFCYYNECKIRTSPPAKSLPWNSEKLSGKPIYELLN